MEKVGILVVSYGSREAAMIDAFTRSKKYKVELYVADKQRNPYNEKKSAIHVVVPDLNIEKICDFAKTNKQHIDFGIVGPEKPIIEGVRDLVEKQTGIPMICPTREYALEQSKARQRLLFEEIVPEVNPRFKIFSPGDYDSLSEVRGAVYDWLQELGNEAVVKPDTPTAGKGVGVWGDHFVTREQLFEHFLSNYRYGSVIIEEKIEGEESSFQAFSDGRHFVPLPDTRDYKRAFDGDEGPNTGGMGSYKGVGDTLPFLTTTDRDKELEIANKIFEKWDRKNDSALRGVPLYLAFMHTGGEPKILENNSRPGDPEVMNILPILKDDFVDVCYDMLDGTLTKINFENIASVATYDVPPDYGGHADAFPNLVNRAEKDEPVDLAEAYRLSEKYGERIRIYPGSMEQRDGLTYALKSRAVCAVGLGETVEEARKVSLEGLASIKGGSLWHRNDVASERHIERSLRHIEELRRNR